jgi:hypothetical protein
MKIFPGASANDAPGNAHDEADTVEAKLLDGAYDRLLEDFRRELDAAELALRECQEAVRIGKARAMERRSHLRLVGTSDDDRSVGPG